MSSGRPGRFVPTSAWGGPPVRDPGDGKPQVCYAAEVLGLCHRGPGIPFCGIREYPFVRPSQRTTPCDVCGRRVGWVAQRVCKGILAEVSGKNFGIKLSSHPQHNGEGKETRAIINT